MSIVATQARANNNYFAKVFFIKRKLRTIPVIPAPGAQDTIQMGKGKFLPSLTAQPGPNAVSVRKTEPLVADCEFNRSGLKKFPT